jgi:hypothetical protein
MNPIVPVQNTNNIRYANFVRITTPSATYRFATTPTALTIPAVDASPFSALGQLVSVGSVQRDIKSTAAETTVTLVGIDTSMLALVLGAELKGSQIEMWHGFFDQNNELLNNQVLNSEDFSNATWVKVRSSIAADVIVAPNGTSTADKLIEDTSTNTHFVSENAISYVSGQIYTASIYAKADTRTNIAMQLPASAFGSNRTVFFNLSTGTITSTSSGAISSIENVGNGWYRCSITSTATATVAVNTNICYLVLSGTTSNYTGDGTSGLYIWGAQIAIGSPSYLATTTAENSGLYQFFNGYINSFSIGEQWMEEARAYVGTATVSASSIQLIMQNRIAGRYTNNNSWQFFNSGDTSMNRVNYISTINYYFGKGAPATS